MKARVSSFHLALDHSAGVCLILKPKLAPGFGERQQEDGEAEDPDGDGH